MEGIRKADKNNWWECSEDTYHEMLGAVPPAYQNGGRFACGEPYTHNNKGQALYYCFLTRGSKFFAFLGTVTELKNTN